VSRKGFIYRRAGTSCWWVAYYDEKGKRRQVSSRNEDEAFARRFLASLERKVAAAQSAGIDLEELTVEKYAERWLKDRELRGVSSWKDDRGRLAHALPVIGKKPLDAVRPGDLRAFMAELRAGGKLAPRSVRHVYATLRVMFSDALAEELIRATPCILKERRGEIPKKRDKNPKWRDTAVFSREEVAQLISDPRIPGDRRTIYALLFLGGMRLGELAARTWSDWDETARPLTRLSVDTSYNRKENRIKDVKTERPRKVPVHPVLAQVLGAWRAEGWAAEFGRSPSPEDWIVPSRTGRNLRDPVVLERLHADLATLGLRTRRTHDTRRTFVSLGLGDGALRDILRWISHGPAGDQLGDYTSLPWESLCEQVLKLKLVTPELQPPPGKEKAPKVQDLGGFIGVPKAGFEAEQDEASSTSAASLDTSFSVDAPVASHPWGTQTQAGCNSVTDPAELLDVVRAWAALPTKAERLRSPLLPAVERFFASAIALEADPSGCERRALLDGFTVSPPWDLLRLPEGQSGSIH
jgi:integrase